MDRRTADVYERDAERWTGTRAAKPRALRRIGVLTAALAPGARVADLGCGPGWYAASLCRRGLTPVALDSSRAMLGELRQRTPRTDAVRGDLAALPFARGSLDAAVAYNTYQHLPPESLPMALAHLHAALRVGAPVDLTIGDIDAVDVSPAARRRGAAVQRWKDDAFPGRLFSFYSRDRLSRLLGGAGFEDVRIERGRGRRFWLWVRAVRAETLPDYVRPGLDILFCGLNPSPVAAATGIPYGRPGNRLWPAVRRAGLCRRDRDPWAAVAEGVGFTDLVKRTTRSARELTTREYADGVERLRDSVRSLRPRVVCFVGLEGWRRAVDRSARAGWVERGFAGRPAYLMPSTSGLNAHCKPADFVRHLRALSRPPRARDAIG